MKRLLCMVLLLLLPTLAAADRLRLAVTTSFANSGLADHLIPALKAETGVDIQVVIVGTGQALRLGAVGDVDAMLVHAPAAERAFVAEGHGLHRREIMFNDFILIGPEVDPAGISGAPDAPAAFAAIAGAEARFISRGDDSGTHQRELTLWQKAGISPSGRWYRAVGQGMGAALNAARAMDAYLLTDRASWLNFGNRQGMKLLFEGGEMLHNQYSFIPVNQQRHPHVRQDLALQVEEWLAGARAQAVIDGYRLHGQAAFIHNARP